MSGLLLVLNAGSSSLKFAAYRPASRADWAVVARGQIEGIGGSPHMAARDGNGASIPTPALVAVRDGHAAFEQLVQWLRATFENARLLAVGHRVVHGGPNYSGPQIVTPAVLKALRELVPLAPLHQPFNLAPIEFVTQRLQHVPQVACFDTSFHLDKPAVARVVPLPRNVCGTAIQRYGFHGLSCEYIASVLPQLAAEIADRRVIVAHLGSGASLCALCARQSVESTFGFTALDGLCMGTRPGAVDPGVILYLFQGLGLSVTGVESLLYKKSGLLGISGISNDMRDLLESSEPAARLAVDYFVYRVIKEIGALTAVLGGVDALVFTAGIGEKSPEIRGRICAASAWLGVQLDAAANGVNALRISSATSRVSVWVIPTNEELTIARHTGRLLGLTEAAA
jgi:acetate kinase